MTFARDTTFSFPSFCLSCFTSASSFTSSSKTYASSELACLGRGVFKISANVCLSSPSSSGVSSSVSACRSRSWWRGRFASRSRSAAARSSSSSSRRLCSSARYITTTHVGTALPRCRTQRTSRFLFAAGLSFGSTVGALLSRVDWRVGIAGCLGFLTRGCTGFAADLPLFVGFNDCEAFDSPSSASNARLRAMVASRSSSLLCGCELSCPRWRLYTVCVLV